MIISCMYSTEWLYGIVLLHSVVLCILAFISSVWKMLHDGVPGEDAYFIFKQKTIQLIQKNLSWEKSINSEKKCGYLPEYLWWHSNIDHFPWQLKLNHEGSITWI